MTLYELKTIFQVASTILIVLIIALQVRQLILKSENIGYILAMMFWMAHALVFYIFVFLNQFHIYNIYAYIPSNAWSSGLRFHAYITIISIEISRLKLINFKRNMEE